MTSGPVTPAGTFDHVGISVADLGTAAGWYCAALGLEREFEFDVPHVGLRGDVRRNTSVRSRDACSTRTLSCGSSSSGPMGGVFVLGESARPKSNSTMLEPVNPVASSGMPQMLP